MGEVFNNQQLVENLSKITSSQHSIQTLSCWCISHRRKAEEIVDTWNRAFSGCHKEKIVPLLYLANDILQNSKLKGNEFVNEFWKVLPGCMRNVYENGEDKTKKIIKRLVEIWEQRKIFGSRGWNLKDVLLGNAPTFSSDIGKNSKLIRGTQKDAHSIEEKLAVGNMSKKRASPDQSEIDEHSNEDTALSKCKDAVQVLEKMEKDITDAFVQGNPQGLALMDELQEQENVVKRSIEQLKLSKATAVMLVAQLKESLKEQEWKLESIENQLQIAQYQTEHASNTRERLVLATAMNGSSMTQPVSQSSPATEPIPPISVTQPQQPQSVTSTASSSSSAEEDHKKTAAAVAAKLLASPYAAQILTSVLADLAAEEVASTSIGLSSQSLSDSRPILHLAKRPRLEKPTPMADMGKTSSSGLGQHLQQSIPVSLAQTSSSLEQLPQYSQVLASAASTSSTPSGFVSGSLAAAQPPPLPFHVSVGLTKLGFPTLHPRTPTIWQQQPSATVVHPQGLGSTDSRRCFNGPATLKRSGRIDGMMGYSMRLL